MQLLEHTERPRQRMSAITGRCYAASGIGKLDG
jgi:hypothetical protein